MGTQILDALQAVIDRSDYAPRLAWTQPAADERIVVEHIRSLAEIVQMRVDRGDRAKLQVTLVLLETSQWLFDARHGRLPREELFKVIAAIRETVRPLAER